MPRLAPFSPIPFDEVDTTPRIAHPFFDAETHRARLPYAGGCDVSFKTMGEGPPLLLLHGLMTSSYSWRYVIGPLSKTHKVYAADLPGNGDSSPVRVGHYAPRNLSDWLKQFIKHVEIEGCAMVANSMGGMLATVAVLEGLNISRLVQVHGPAFVNPRLKALSMALRLPGSEAMLHSLVKKDPERWVHKNVHYFDDTLKSREEHAQYAAPLKSEEGRRAFYCYLKETMAPRHLEWMTHLLQKRESRGERFPVPLLLLYARQDPLVPPDNGERLKKAIPEAYLRWLDNASHFAHVDNPEGFLHFTAPFLAGEVPPRTRR